MSCRAEIERLLTDSMTSAPATLAVRIDQQATVEELIKSLTQMMDTLQHVALLYADWFDRIHGVLDRPV